MARILSKEVRSSTDCDAPEPRQYAHLLRPGDLLLVEGNTRFATIVKYLTQSTWSHVAMYVGPFLPPAEDDEHDPKVLIEADVADGVIAVPLSKYSTGNTRVCRPVGLSVDDTKEVRQFMIDHLGHHYDLKNIFDLLRYFLPKPRFFSHNRRKYLEIGSGEPTRAICSSLIAQAFQGIHYPILPRYKYNKLSGRAFIPEEAILMTRHHSLFVPRDFDLSPYFSVIKPTLEGFDFRHLQWAGPHQDDRCELPSSSALVGEDVLTSDDSLKESSTLSSR